MSPVHRDARLRVPDDVVFREIAGESMILHLGSGIYFGLDGVGTRAWQLLAEHGSIEGVVSAMATEFDADASTISADVTALVNELLRKHLLEITPDP
ncbi:MAG: PqqD family protein [Vicinamibacterales bacterium]